MLFFLNGEAFEDCVFFLLKQLIMLLHSHRFAEVTLKKMLVFTKESVFNRNRNKEIFPVKAAYDNTCV
jgi:hypothetical protein